MQQLAPCNVPVLHPIPHLPLSLPPFIIYLCLCISLFLALSLSLSLSLSFLLWGGGGGVRSPLLYKVQTLTRFLDIAIRYG